MIAEELVMIGNSRVCSGNCVFKISNDIKKIIYLWFIAKKKYGVLGEIFSVAE